MLWDFHGTVLNADWNADDLGERWQASFGSRPPMDGDADLSFSLDIVSAIPPPPPGPPQFRQTDLIEYYTEGNSVIAHFPRYGQLRLDLAEGITHGNIIRAALDTYGVFEDLIAIGLSPHLRRRGMYLMHAFATVGPFPRPVPSTGSGVSAQDVGQKKGVLIVGEIGSGKTTTGMALLDAGWKLLSNDSPIINASGEILSYPGLLAAYPNTLDRFDSTRHLIPLTAYAIQKTTFAAESIWSDVWAESAHPAAILFPKIEPRDDHALEPLRQPEALRMLLPHAIEQWDRDMIPAHLALLNQLVQAAPAFRLRLGSETSALPEVVASVLKSDH